MNLYIQPAAPSFEKNASEVTLPEDANAWPHEITQELYKQVPFIADFEPEVKMDRVDAERGYGFGHVEVMNKTEMRPGADPASMEAVGVQQVRIPVIIRDRKLYPFDVIVTSDSKSLPLNEGRLRQALFRPQAFDVTSRTPGDQSMVGQLYPPYRQNYGFGGGGGGGAGMSVGMGKEGQDQPHLADRLQTIMGLSADEVAKLKAKQKIAAQNIPNSTLNDTTSKTRFKDVVPPVKTASLLSLVLHTIEEKDFNRVAKELSDSGVQAAYVKNASATADVLGKLLSFDPKVKRASSLSLKPSVTQIVKVAEGYILKTANNTAWAIDEELVDRGTVVRKFDSKIALAADMTGSVTMTEGDGAKEDTGPESKAEIVARFGLYKVKDTEGKELVGFVFPNLYDSDGTALPISLFTNGSASALQDAIAGEDVGKSQGFGYGPVSGHGAFVRRLPNGSAEAMIPMTVMGSYSDESGKKMQVETYDGRTLFVSVQPNISKPSEVDGTCIVPADMQWLPLGDSAEVALVSDPEQYDLAKTASLRFESVVVRASSPSTFSLSGRPIDKVASSDRDFLTVDDALFYLGGLGVDLDYAGVKMAEALAFGQPVLVKISREITPLEEAHEKAASAHEALLLHFPSYKKNLVKEAAFIPDPAAVDTILSLGFINPENVLTFVEYLPQIDQVQSKLCELLIGARLGMSDIPIGALEKAIRSSEEVIDGLKILAYQKQ